MTQRAPFRDHAWYAPLPTDPFRADDPEDEAIEEARRILRLPLERHTLEDDLNDAELSFDE